MGEEGRESKGEMKQRERELWMEQAGRWGEVQWSAESLGEQGGDPRTEAEDGVTHGVGGCGEEAQAPVAPSAGGTHLRGGRRLRPCPPAKGSSKPGPWAKSPHKASNSYI